NLGILCIGSGLAKSRLLIKLTAATRLLVMASVTMLVAVRAAPPVVLGVGVIDLASAALTIWALAGGTQAHPSEVVARRAYLLLAMILRTECPLWLMSGRCGVSG